MEPDGSTEFQSAVREGISQADPADVDPRDWKPLNLALWDADRVLVGGLVGATMWGWLMIDALWVAQHLRGQGHGGQLLQ